MPKARKFKQVIIRSNGLYLFSAPGTYDISGKVIIELRYKPKGHKWEDGTWKPLDEEEIAKQTIEDYGPLEMLSESRDSLLWRYKHGLDQFLTQLIKKPEVVLKRTRPKKRVRAVNRIREKVDFDKLFEKFHPAEILERPEETLQKSQFHSEQDLLHQFLRAVRHGDIKFREPDSFKERFSDGQIQILKELLSNPDIAHRLREIQQEQKKEEAIDQLLEDEDEDEGDELTGDISREEAESWEGAPGADTLEELVEEADSVLDKVDYAAISTAVDGNLYKLYTEILDPLMKAAKAEGKSTNYAENVIKMLRWEPDIILSDETESPTPPPPAKYSPVRFGQKERQVIKFWVESIRLIHMIQGQVNMELDAGFLFENPGSDAYEGEYLSESGGGGEGYTQDIGSFKAVLIAPATIGGAGNWIHRYKLRDYTDVYKVVSIAFHEVVHAHLGRSDETAELGHEATFANMLTDDLVLAMKHSSAFPKLARFCADLYPIRLRGEKAKKKPARGISRGAGYYSVKCEGRRGRAPKFKTLREARKFVSDYHTESPGKDCEIFAHYRPIDKGKDDINVGEIETIGRWDSPIDLDARLRGVRALWDDDFRDDWRSDYVETYGEDIFHRRNKKIRRRKRRR
jgi:hypothetical protein